MSTRPLTIDLDPDIEGDETDTYEPSIAETAPTTRNDTFDAFACSCRDISASTSSPFLSNVGASDLKQPWEVGPMKFLSDDDVYDSMHLGMPLAWDSSNAPKEFLNQNQRSSEPGPQFPKPCQTMNCTLAIKDATFWQDRNAVMLRAVKRWLFILNLDRSASSCGVHLDEALTEDDEKAMLIATFCTKSPHTAIKRGNAVLEFYRWRSCFSDSAFLPFQENAVWQYVTARQQPEQCHLFRPCVSVTTFLASKAA